VPLSERISCWRSSKALLQAAALFLVASWARHAPWSRRPWPASGRAPVGSGVPLAALGEPFRSRESRAGIPPRISMVASPPGWLRAVVRRIPPLPCSGSREGLPGRSWLNRQLPAKSQGHEGPLRHGAPGTGRVWLVVASGGRPLRARVVADDAGSSPCMPPLPRHPRGGFLPQEVPPSRHGGIVLHQEEVPPSQDEAEVLVGGVLAAEESARESPSSLPSLP